MSNLKRFIRSEILNFQEYKTVSSVWDLAEQFGKNALKVAKLDQGENFYGTSPKVAQALGSYNFFNYYPDPEYKKLRRAIGKNIKVPSEKIMVGSGSDELIDLLFRLTLNPGDKVDLNNKSMSSSDPDPTIIFSDGTLIFLPIARRNFLYSGSG